MSARATLALAAAMGAALAVASCTSEDLDPMERQPRYGPYRESGLFDDGRAMLLVPLLGYSDGSSEPVLEMMRNPRSVLSLADGGAHVGIVCDASMPTYMLTHWTRDRDRGDRVSIEMIVQKQCRQTAELYGLLDRGLIAPGMLGDVNVIDYDALALENPEVRDDMPAGGRRLLQGARGYVATIKRGVVTYRNGVATGAHPGRLVRGAQPAPAV